MRAGSGNDETARTASRTVRAVRVVLPTPSADRPRMPVTLNREKAGRWTGCTPLGTVANLCEHRVTQRNPPAGGLDRVRDERKKCRLALPARMGVRGEARGGGGSTWGLCTTWTLSAKIG